MLYFDKSGFGPFTDIFPWAFKSASSGESVNRQVNNKCLRVMSTVGLVVMICLFRIYNMYRLAFTFQTLLYECFTSCKSRGKSLKWMNHGARDNILEESVPMRLVSNTKVFGRGNVYNEVSC